MTADDSLRKAQRASRALVRKMGKLIAFFRAHEEFTTAEVQMASGLSKEQALRLLREMWREGPDRQIRICRWLEDRMGRPTIRVYEWGTAPDEKRRPPVSPKVRTQLWLERKEKRAHLAAQQAILNMARPMKEET